MNVDEFNNYNLKIGITHGDFNGISYELVLKTLNDSAIHETLTPVFFGCSKLVSYFRNYFNYTDFSFTPVRQNEITPNKPNLFNIFSEEVRVTLGETTEEAANLAVLSITKAYNAINNRFVDALVCCPVSQAMLKETSSHHIGNGSYFINKLQSTRSMQILCNDYIKLTAATSKVNYEELTKLLTIEYLFEKIKTLHKIMFYDFMISSPKIAILAANSVDNTGKYIDGEVEDIIEKTNDLAIQNRIQSFGPYLPSTFFNSNEYQKFDVIMTITNQQADTIFSLLNGRDGVVYTSGLPFVVTEPYHLNGQEVGDCQAFRSALYLASDITKNRRMNYKLRKTALQRDRNFQDNSSNTGENKNISENKS
ncbi:MAG: 4-hydroxythreonine-4-phosphate dehydrogenase PdxA [Bacteroidales bacterium]|jgi:4-hydroxythreonine-4-phosphate dehydrogenase|nr:4-hydroxythreonine-4-phosphate dehydrogenase PdxA [Bacteroidales bacterium]